MEEKKTDKTAVVFIDVQRGFVTGKLGSDRAIGKMPKIVELAKRAKAANCKLYATRDTHAATVRDEAGMPVSGYMATLEGKNLPVEHCVQGTDGWQIMPELVEVLGTDAKTVDKPTFGSFALAGEIEADCGKKPKIYICGFCTDICVASNALILRAAFPDAEICVVADCCAGVSDAKHEAALDVLDSCQIGTVEAAAAEIFS